MILLRRLSKNRIVAEDQSSKDILAKGFIGNSRKKGSTELSIFEALYLVDVRNASVLQGKVQFSFNDIAGAFWKDPKFMAKYLTYKDWRDRGLIIKTPDFDYTCPNSTPVKKYPSSKLSLPKCLLAGTFFMTDLVTVVNQAEEAKNIYESLWFGQYGSYKAPDRGHLNKLDIYEALFLAENSILDIENITEAALKKELAKKYGYFPLLYSVYRDWRKNGYVVKTGFKFGTHFRIYFPGARPFKANNSSWVHSKHVIHVFPRKSRLLISEWARAIRVAHSVRKTFILAVPGKKSSKKAKIDFVLYHRKGGDSENPKENPPRYVMLSLGEEEYIGGSELASAINEAKRRKMELVIAIADRETAVTYYRIRQITLKGSKSEYYEIDWIQP